MTFTGKFKYQTNENYEEYLRLLGTLSKYSILSAE